MSNVLSYSSAKTLGIKIASRDVSRTLDEYAEIKAPKSNVSDEAYITLAKSALDQQVNAHYALNEMLVENAELADEILTLGSDKKVTTSLEKLINTIDSRALDSKELEVLFADYDATKFLKKIKFDFNHFLNSKMNTREEKRRLRKALLGKAHSYDLSIYKDLFSGKLSASTSNDTLRYHFEKEVHKTTRQSNAFIKFCAYMNAVRSIVKVEGAMTATKEQLYKVEFDLESDFMQYMKKRIA